MADFSSLNGYNVKDAKARQDINQLSNPNLLINGDFQVWQRGESFTFNGDNARHYTADRWGVYYANLTINKVADGLQMIGNDYIFQALENPLEIGEVYTVSYSKNGVITSTQIIGGEFATDFTDGVRYTPISSNYYHSILIMLESGDVLNWVKLEKGSIATPFVHRPYVEELAMCQRFYQRLFYQLGHGNVYRNGVYATVPLSCPMRITSPTVNGAYNYTAKIDGVSSSAISHVDGSNCYGNIMFVYFYTTTAFGDSLDGRCARIIQTNSGNGSFDIDAEIY